MRNATNPPHQKLLTRDQFRRQVFERDNFKCVFCGEAAKDAHHIIERRLWGNGGYYLDNGASVCETHHIMCETTKLSVEEVRAACGITKEIIPAHLYNDVVYDKWGNVVQPNGTRLKGELFWDESVQKILEQGKVLHLFTDYIKYPRTHHVSWSENINDDDRVIDSMKEFDGKEVVVTQKWDGQNFTLYRDYLHGRSLDGRSHPSQDWLKNFWQQIRFDIPPQWRICGENLFAKHSIHYINLPAYFMAFSVWNDRNVCLGWDETLEWFSMLGITPVDTLYRGVYDEGKIRSLWDHSRWDQMEGYVIRLTESFPYSDFRRKVGKFVRKNHIQTVRHDWHKQAIERNLLGT